MTGGFSMMRVDQSSNVILAPLLQQYCSEMRAWFPRLPEDFTYPLEKTWSIDTDVYLAYLEKDPVGFALVGSAQNYLGDPSARDMVEFFVTRRFRREGVGRAMAAELWHQYPGKWLVRVLQSNVPAMRFWAAAIADQPCGERREDQCSVSGDAWTYFTFAPSKQRLERP